GSSKERSAPVSRAAAEPLVAGRPVAFGVALLAVLAAGLACVSLGLALGAVLPRLPAALLTLAVSAAALLTGALRSFELPMSPFAGMAVLAHLDDAGAPLGDALRSGGTALALSAVLLVLAAALLERVDL
ncbi:MAG TPA: hypothetical protein VHK28_00915, partial [Candidatus Limnocylindria bacterium]|nr:hypothetical protein [Candidatus Limnocylindria bacterium]